MTCMMGVCKILTKTAYIWQIIRKNLQCPLMHMILSLPHFITCALLHMVRLFADIIWHETLILYDLEIIIHCFRVRLC